MLLVLAVGAVVSGFLMAHHRDQSVAEMGGQYVCPMHPDVTARAPRECPICGMALVKAGILAREGGAPGESGLGEEGDEIAAAQLLRAAAGGVAPTVLTYSPAPVRRRVAQQEPLAPAWLESDSVAAVLLYNDELSTLGSDERVEFYPTSDPEAALDLRVGGEPPTAWDRSTSVLRFAIEMNPAHAAAGTPGWVKLARKARESVVVPAMSVLQSAEGPYVLVFSAARGTVAKRPIEIGKTFSGFAAVVSGLSTRELVVSMNTFFWDAERRLQAEQRGGPSP